MSKKTIEIENFLKEPIKVGDWIFAKGHNSRNPEQENMVQVREIKNDRVFYKYDTYHELQSRLITEVTKSTRHIGANPFEPEIRSMSYQIDIEQLFWRCGFSIKRKEDDPIEVRLESFGEVKIRECTLNPIVIDKNGDDVEYQRGLVWSLEQKQMLIESIYNHIEIGKFVIRKRGYNWVTKRIKNNKLGEGTAFGDLVDGKQRFNAIKGFVMNEFSDMHSNYYSDLSKEAHGKIMGYRALTYVELPEETSDADTIKTFLAINHTGIPMSKEHIEFVKSIKV